MYNSKREPIGIIAQERDGLYLAFDGSRFYHTENEVDAHLFKDIVAFKSAERNKPFPLSAKFYRKLYVYLPPEDLTDVKREKARRSKSKDYKPSGKTLYAKLIGLELRNIKVKMSMGDRLNAFYAYVKYKGLATAQNLDIDVYNVDSFLVGYLGAWVARLAVDDAATNRLRSDFQRFIQGEAVPKIRTGREGRNNG